MTEENIRELNSYETTGIEYITAIESQLADSEKHLESRLKSVPDAWRQWRIARSATTKVLWALCSTVPDKMLRHLQRLVQNGEVVIRPKPIVKSKEDRLVPEDALKMLINTTMACKCAICLEDGKAAKRCKLRKALMLIVPPDEIGDIDCPYSDVTMQNKLGEYI